MKVTEKGGIKLAKNERRIGGSNFFIKDEGTHMKLFDISEVATHRVLKDTPLGSYLRLCYEQLSDDVVCRSLRNYIAVLWTVCCAVPDAEFLGEIYGASEACMRRHPEIYGELPRDVTEEEDAEIIRGLKEEREMADSLVELGEEGGEG